MASIVFGLYAGVGAGKSTVAGCFAALGALVLDADEFVHAAYRDPIVRSAVQARFGAAILTLEGVDRAALARLVFRDAEARRDLESIVHPAVRQGIESALLGPESMSRPAFVLDVPLLVGSPLERFVTVGIYIDAPLAVREARVRAARGWEPGEVARRDQVQASLEAKRARCRYVVWNDEQTDAESLRQQVQAIWSSEVAPSRSVPRSL